MACTTCGTDMDDVPFRKRRHDFGPAYQRQNQSKHQLATFGEQMLFTPHKTSAPQQNLAVTWLDGGWLGFSTRTGAHIVSKNAAVVSCRSIRRRNKEERWNRNMLLGILGNPWSLQDGRVEVDPNPAARARYIPVVNSEVEGGPTVTKTRNEEKVRRTYFTKKRVSAFGATLCCKGFLGDRTTAHGGVPGQDHSWIMILHTRNVSKTT